MGAKNSPGFKNAYKGPNMYKQALFHGKKNHISVLGFLPCSQTKHEQINNNNKKICIIIKL